MHRTRGGRKASGVALAVGVTVGLAACAGGYSSPAPSASRAPVGTASAPLAEATPTKRPAPTPFALNDSLGTPMLSTPGAAPGAKWAGLKFSSIADQFAALPSPTEFGGPQSPVFNPPVRWTGGWVTSWQTTEEHDGQWLALVSPDGATYLAVRSASSLNGP